MSSKIIKGRLNKLLLFIYLQQICLCTCIVDQCADCDNNSTITCNLCKKGYFLIDFYSAEKRHHYQDCWSLKKTLWIATIGCVSSLTVCGFCFLFYKLGRSRALENSKKIKNENFVKKKKLRKIVENFDENTGGGSSTRRIVRRKSTLPTEYISNMPTQRSVRKLEKNSSMSRRNILNGPKLIRKGQNRHQRYRNFQGKNLRKTASKRSFRSVQSRMTMNELSTPTPSRGMTSPGIVVLGGGDQYSVGNFSIGQGGNPERNYSSQKQLPPEIRNVINQRHGMSRKTVILRADGSKTVLGE